MKHIEVDYLFVRSKIQADVLRVSHISSADQLAYALTKSLSRTTFEKIRSKIGVSVRLTILRGRNKETSMLAPDQLQLADIVTISIDSLSS